MKEEQLSLLWAILNFAFVAIKLAHFKKTYGKLLFSQVTYKIAHSHVS